ncbi:MAG: amidohydrolase family protein [Candidatus Nitrosopolaris sp.]
MMQNTCDILVANAAGVMIPKVGIVQTNIMIENGKIKALTKSTQSVQASRKINAEGKYVLPGIIDPHVHYGVYTPIEEAARTESRSAALGGVTTMMRMLRMNERYGNIEKHLQASQCTHHVDYSIHASILRPNQINDIQYLKKKFGINSFKIYANLGQDVNHILMDLEPGTHEVVEGEVNITDQIISDIIQEASMTHSIVLVHAEDPVICSRLQKQKQIESELTGTRITSLRVWSGCRPPSSEANTIVKVGAYAREFGSTIYFVHIGSGTALDSILAEKEKGNSNLYIETCPHYLTHTSDFLDVTGKVVPPLRTKIDVQSMWFALMNGIIDTVGSDHVANRLLIKKGQGDIWSARAGFPGIATLLPVMLSKGVNEGRISLERVAEVTSYNAARIFGLYPKKGTIEIGSDADVTIIDLDLLQKVTPEILQSYSDYSIYEGWELQGWPLFTIVRGRVIMENGQVDKTTCGYGEFVRTAAVA